MHYLKVLHEQSSSLTSRWTLSVLIRDNKFELVASIVQGHREGPETLASQPKLILSNKTHR